MATTFAHQMPSVDYFSFSRRAPELQTNSIPSETIWDQSPSSDPALQSPSSDESLLVSPVSPYTSPFSRGGYALPTQQAGIDQKEDPSLLYNSSFEDWMRWDDSVDNTLYPSVKSEYVNPKMEPASPIMGALELSGGLGVTNTPAMMPNGLDDGSVAFQDSISEEPLFQAPQDIQAQRNNDPFSNPLPWSQSQPHHPPNHPITAYPLLSQSETSQLISIAMPTTPARTSPSSQQPENRRKRKSTSSATSSSSSNSASSNPPPRRQSAPVKKTAHNMIEKRYRTNLNDKIAALRDSVPSLRITEKKDLHSESAMQEDLSGLEAAQKLNKATILSKATEYIAHLEKRNIYLSKECQSLKDRVDAFEILLMSRSGLGAQNPSASAMSISREPNTNQQSHRSRWKQQHARPTAVTTA